MSILDGAQGPGQETLRSVEDDRKRCSKCGVVKPLSGFHRRNDGHHEHCKECRRAYRQINRDRARESDRRYYRRNREKVLAKTRQRDDTAKGRAGKALRWAVQSGRLTKPKSCENCGAGGLIHGHHTDYSKPLEVEWLCTNCHGRRHAVGDVANQRKGLQCTNWLQR